MSAYRGLLQAKNAHLHTLLRRKHVVGVGVGYKNRRGQFSDELSLVVLVREKIPPAALPEEDLIPPEVGGVRTDVVKVGDLRAMNAHTQRYRPTPAGVSLGHYQVTAGTLGCLVYERTSGERLILSNNHVLANTNQALAGDPILQPAPADGGQVGRDTLAYLERFIPLRFTTEPATCTLAMAYAALGNRLARWLGASHRLQAYQLNPHAANRVDAALARPIRQDDLLEDVLELGSVSGATRAELGMAVLKSGRTSGLTQGTITVLEASLRIAYGEERAALFEGQIVTTPMSQGGDSGSLLVSAEGHHAVGLLFAGSSQATIFNPIQDVLEALQVDLLTPDQTPKNRQTLVERAQAVRRAYAPMLMAKPNVVGVGLGLRRRQGKRTDEVCLVVMVERKVPKGLLHPEEVIPSEIEGVPVDVRQVGRLIAQSKRSTNAR